MIHRPSSPRPTAAPPSRSAALLLLGVALATAAGCQVLRPGYRCDMGCCDTACCDTIGCGCDAGPGCAVECPDAGCGCEPSCGASAFCGRSLAGQRWEGDGCCQGPRICVCKDACGNCDNGFGGCGCGDASCAMEPGCGEPSCGEPACGCGGCGCRAPVRRGIYAIGRGVGFGLRTIASEIRCITGPLFGCNGCDGELYWSEWHNDPPRCCDPCDRCGNWIGPSSTPMSHRAPYAHPYAPGGEEWIGSRPTLPHETIRR